MATKHGMNGTRTYTVWKSMKARCNNSNHHWYSHYGARGITLCQSWNDFSEFYRDMGDAPEGLSLDRIDNNGPYSKSNCKWASCGAQQRNTRRTRLVELDGEIKCVRDWELYFGLSVGALWHRVKRGMSYEQAVKLGAKK